jgi:NAD(P)-dependent dehydrogenase (short-subunit alcohol dehydrogenase family)
MTSASLSPTTKSDFAQFAEMVRTKPKRPPPFTSLAGQVAIITGSNVGIGLEAARVFLDLQLSHIIIAVRTVEKGESAAAALRHAHPNAKIDVWPLDMLSYEPIQGFAQRCSALSRLDIVVLNAAASKSIFSIDQSTGQEETFQVNYLSTALLAILLLPILKVESPPPKPARLTIVSSGLAVRSKFCNRNEVPLIPSFSDPSSWNGLSDGGERYAVTKTLGLILTLKLSQHLSVENVAVSAVDPGFTAGSMLHRYLPLFVRLSVRLLATLTGRSLEQAAWTYVDAAAVTGSESHGSLLMTWDVCP